MVVWSSLLFTFTCKPLKAKCMCTPVVKPSHLVTGGGVGGGGAMYVIMLLQKRHWQWHLPLFTEI